MKCGGYEQHYRFIAPPVGGLRVEGSQPTPLYRNQGKITFNCDCCGLQFERYPSQAAGFKHHYCGRACSWAAKVIRIPKNCAVCGKEMLITPSAYTKTATCCRECLRKNRVVNNINRRTSPEYMATVKRLLENSVCHTCGTTSGPWVAQGIKTWVEDRISLADGSAARLVCRHCHMKFIASSGGDARQHKEQK